MSKVTMSSEGQKSTAGKVPIPRSRRGAKGFFTEVVREMKKVNWPTKPETTRLTGVVLAVCLLVVTILSMLSFVFGTIIGILTGGGR
jgi:preprotein translocase subunit SecE